MKTITLSRGLATQVDDDVYEWASHHKWHVAIARGKQYAKAKINGEHLALHRMVVQAKPGQLVDHINGNSLDNQSANLRIANHSQNAANRPARAGHIKGVRWDRRRGYFIYYIRCRGQRYSQGGFTTSEAASIAYEAHAAKLFGPFARHLSAPPPPPQAIEITLPPEPARWPRCPGKYRRRRKKPVKPVVRAETTKVSSLARLLGITTRKLIQDLSQKGFAVEVADNRISHEAITAYLLKSGLHTCTLI